MRNAPYIFIDMHFKRKGESIFVLAMMGARRNISINKELLVFKSEKEILKIIGDIVREHYTVHHGKLNLWGKIYNYVYHHTNSETYIFDTDGALLHNQGEILESRAEIRLGNQIIGGMENG